ncbi:MAG: hypothetical protein CMJ38_05850 [Phycisphaerae bacterium]|nr:hypothetical protein [Phycisphaerae bacterium]
MKPVIPPKKGKANMKLKTAMEDLRLHAPASWVIESIDANFSPDRMVAGLTYAMDGQIRTLKLSEGEISASVQCTEEKPFKLTIKVPVLTSDGWMKVAKLMAVEARMAARLSAGRIPPTLAAMLRECNQSPFIGDIESNCTCKDKKPCKHAAAALFLTAERLLATPLRYFEMRGTGKDDLLLKLRQARTLDAKGQAKAHSSVREDVLPELVPFESCLEDFWRMPRSPKDADRAPMPPHLPHTLLRRLGISPMDAKFPMVGLLETIYDEVSRIAREQRRDS